MKSCGVCGADHLAVTLKCPPPSAEYLRGYRAGIEAAAKVLDKERECWPPFGGADVRLALKNQAAAIRALAPGKGE